MKIKTIFEDREKLKMEEEKQMGLFFKSKYSDTGLIKIIAWLNK